MSAGESAARGTKGRTSRKSVDACDVDKLVGRPCRSSLAETSLTCLRVKVFYINVLEDGVDVSLEQRKVDVFGVMRKSE